MTSRLPEPMRPRTIRKWFEEFPAFRFPFPSPRDLFGELGEEPWAPAVDIVEKDGSIVVKADLPGVNKEDVTAEIEDGALVIRAERKREEEKTGEGYTRKEHFFGRFERALLLPEGADAEGTVATYEDGVLEVTVPVKAIEPKPGARKIAIQ